MQHDISAIKAAFLKFKKSIINNMDNHTDALDSAYDMGRDQDIIAPTLEMLTSKLSIISLSDYEVVHCLYMELEASGSMKEWREILTKYRNKTMHTQAVTKLVCSLTEVAYQDFPEISTYVDKMVADAGFTNDMLNHCYSDEKFARLMFS